MLITYLGIFQGKDFDSQDECGLLSVGFTYHTKHKHCYGLGSPVDTEYVLNSPLEILSVRSIPPQESQSLKRLVVFFEGCGIWLAADEAGV